jgi:hypothetical protein
LKAFRVFAHINLCAANHNRAFGHQHASSKNGDLLKVVVAHGIGLHIQRLVAVGFFAPCGSYQAGTGQAKKQGIQEFFHKGTKLAVSISLRL